MQKDLIRLPYRMAYEVENFLSSFPAPDEKEVESGGDEEIANNDPAHHTTPGAFNKS